jgi:outer membrane protein OmpA-like peptidoglycan-associated protein
MKSFLKFFLFLALSVCSFSVSYAQNEKRLIKEAQDNLVKGDKKNALVFYLKALDKNPENPETNFMIGKLYLETVYKHRSLKYLEKAYALKPTVDPEINKCLAESYHVNMMWDKAIEQYELCRKTLHKDHAFHKHIDREIFECNVGKELVAKPVEAKIENLGGVINSAYPDFAPVISADESVMIFTSRREGSTGGEIDENGEFNEDIYITEKIDGKWSAPKNIGTNINTSGHDASIGLSADGKGLFTYDGTGQGDIKYCKLKKDSSWSKPYLMSGGINTKHSETSICISPDGGTVFFTSDREGGHGGFDIYMSHQDKKGDWSKAVNLGTTINTSDDDEGPFMDLDGKTLYFSSRAHKGMGGYDLFKSVYDSVTSKWSEPENLGYPINTADDDIYFVLSGDGRHGYYASVREDGLGEKDIYMITMPEREDYHKLVKKMEVLLKKEIPVKDTTPVAIIAPKPEPVKLYPVLLKGTVLDKTTGTPLSAKVQITEGNKTLMEITTGADGKYSYETSGDKERSFTLTAQKEVYGFTSKTISVPPNGKEKVELDNDLELKKLEVGTKFVLRNIYFDFDKATLKQESYTELNKLLKLLQDNPALKVQIGGHTDSKGSNEYNKILSERRSRSVVNWLVGKGISKSRLSARGYGEEVPLASNDDEEEGRELNRRTEFEVTSN